MADVIGLTLFLGTILILIGIFGGVVIICIYFEYKRGKDLIEKEKALIEKGLYKPSEPIEITKKILIAGLILAGIGAAISIGVYWETGLCIWMIVGLGPSSIGIALLISYMFIREK